VSSADKPIDDQSLVERALAARDRAYAPYSNYRVGCVLVAGGEVFEGANVENASYGLAICAERSAVARAVYEGQKTVDTAVIATESSPPAAPCGMCLQTLHEFAGDPAAMRMILVNPEGERGDFTLAELFPRGFHKSQLTDRE